MNAMQRQLRIIEDGQQREHVFKVAFASESKHCVDQHFGSAHTFLVYGFGEQHIQLLEALQFEQAKPGHDKGRLQQRINALAGCAAVFSNACGHSANQLLKQHGICSLMVDSDTELSVLLGDIHLQFVHQPLPWMYPQALDALEKEQRLNELLDEPW
ncbi:NifB/NifX family molybdenum-iron cluster-binding protein [Agarivorans sp. Alg241-V36]|uniref:NifB/NifX family molybdenum-iron cluster-binding protein n=1 Tax=Agarivorans sp. Alg241-V36 TaxID=2305992 RepID=UPI0013D21153|nr:NifB/NifX family molybdenum-iron cluster-binding protein [Agarivorans sp. Alg241-V36]